VYGIAKAARERAAVLERQLTIAQERLGAERGAQIVDASLATEAAERDVAFERVVVEIESLKQCLAAATPSSFAASAPLKRAC